MTSSLRFTQSSSKPWIILEQHTLLLDQDPGRPHPSPSIFTNFAEIFFCLLTKEGLLKSNVAFKMFIYLFEKQ